MCELERGDAVVLAWGSAAARASVGRIERRRQQVHGAEKLAVAHRTMDFQSVDLPRDGLEVRPAICPGYLSGPAPMVPSSSLT